MLSEVRLWILLSYYAVVDLVGRPRPIRWPTFDDKILEPSLDPQVTGYGTRISHRMQVNRLLTTNEPTEHFEPATGIIKNNDRTIIRFLWNHIYDPRSFRSSIGQDPFLTFGQLDRILNKDTCTIKYYFRAEKKKFFYKLFSGSQSAAIESGGKKIEEQSIYYYIVVRSTQ